MDKTINLETINNNLELLKQAVSEIKLEITNINEDSLLTEEEIDLVNKSIENEKQRNLVSSEQLKKDLGI